MIIVTHFSSTVEVRTSAVYPMQGRDTPPRAACIYLTLAFQSSPLTRKTVSSPFLKLHSVISIHSPYAGRRDLDGFKRCMKLLISIHSPYTRERLWSIKGDNAYIYSNPSPYKEGKISPLWTYHYREQSTLPIQEGAVTLVVLWVKQNCPLSLPQGRRDRYM